MTHFELIKTAKQAEAERKRLRSAWSNETRLSQRVLILCLATLEEIASNGHKQKSRRPLSSWQKFFSAAMKRGLTARQAAQNWKIKQAG